jgi:hypothetical protein
MLIMLVLRSSHGGGGQHHGDHAPEICEKTDCHAACDVVALEICYYSTQGRCKEYPCDYVIIRCIHVTSRM